MQNVFSRLTVEAAQAAVGLFVSRVDVQTVGQAMDYAIRGLRYFSKVWEIPESYLVPRGSPKSVWTHSLYPV